MPVIQATLANYLKLLFDCGLLKGFDKYAGDTIPKRGSSPKFQKQPRVIRLMKKHSSILNCGDNLQSLQSVYT
ncbi:hypothetical protein KL86DYS1_10104 [uncultured Dysgonomonas sp.]|uniref:Uncharacterized protein n=1 Tax=uncultured Dysgonomonas sp. TaxID=206096 RepID=A0A212ITL7_9BACT|nr:hypothetical protein KL86DYS1_10104 [uncultured Dysgonomonas sp.]